MHPFDLQRTVSVSAVGGVRNHPNPFGKAIEFREALRDIPELRAFIDRVRSQSGHRIATLVWEALLPCLDLDRAPVRLQPTDTLRFVITPDRTLPEIEQRNLWLNIFDSRIIKF